MRGWEGWWGRRAGWRHVHEWWHDPLCRARSRKSWSNSVRKTKLGVWCLIYIMCSSGFRLEPQSFSIMQKGPPMKLHLWGLHTRIFSTNFSDFFSSYVGRSSSTNLPVIHILIKHTSTSFALSSLLWHCNWSLQQSKQPDCINKIILFLSENILTVLILAFP